MRVREAMTENPFTCAADATLVDVARQMEEHDVGAIPIVNTDGDRKVIGIITDRDIVCRAVADGQNPAELSARDCMSAPVITCSADADLEECEQLMADDKIRRVVVVDRNGDCVGIVAQADIARYAEEEDTGELVREVSAPVESPSAVH